MRYNKFIATGYTQRGIKVTEAHTAPEMAAQAFFKDNPYMDHCVIKRVSQRITGETCFDPNFAPKRIDKHFA
jgi:hypothetical protein